MPLYEYQCRSCGTVSEYLVGVGSDQPDVTCDSCGSDELRQMISIVSVARGAAPDGCCGGSCDDPGSCERGGYCACGD